MSECLHPCESCERHIKGRETTCPFCGVTLSAGFGICASARRGAHAPLTRAAILFMGAAAIAACDDDDDTSIVPLYGPAPVADASMTDAPSEAQPTIDAAPPTDAAKDGGDADPDSGGPVALYGPAPVDGGADG